MSFGYGHPTRGPRLQHEVNDALVGIQEDVRELLGADRKQRSSNHRFTTAQNNTCLTRHLNNAEDDPQLADAIYDVWIFNQTYLSTHDDEPVQPIFEAYLLLLLPLLTAELDARGHNSY
ncbi:hypothetical protein PMIN05_006445 [Paraphaeosphaeria minitans]